MMEQDFCSSSSPKRIYDTISYFEESDIGHILFNCAGTEET